MCTIYYWFPLLPFIHLWIHTACWVSWLDNSNFIHSFLETYCLLSVFFIRFGIHATCWASWLNNSDFFLLRLQSINYLVRVSFAVKNRASRSKNVWVFWTFLYCQFFTEHVLLNRWSFKHQLSARWRWRSSFLPVISLYIYLYYPYSLCMFVFICTYLRIHTWGLLETVGIGGLFVAHFCEKKKWHSFFFTFLK